MKHFKIAFKKSEESNHRVYKLEGKDAEFNGITKMLTYYENNRIDPALRSIGRCISVQNYEATKAKIEWEHQKSKVIAAKQEHQKSEEREEQRQTHVHKYRCTIL